jgi:hypothetical protein
MGALLIIVAAITWGTTGATMKLVAAGSPMSPLIVLARRAGPHRRPA